jgi:outer membrane immunogenic protein
MRPIAISLFAAGLSLGIASAAFAADIPAKAPVYKAPVVAAFNWAGWYAGLNAGGAWGHSDPSTSTVFSPAGYFAATSVTAIGVAGQQRAKTSGFTGGGQLGYNWQWGNTVFGLETDFEYFRQNGSATSGAVYPCCAPTAFTINSSVTTDWLFTARPRLGWAVNNWLFYVTGGLALTELKGNFTFTDTFATALETASVSKTKAGWTVGGGVEAGLWGNWTAKVEYLYVDFGSTSATSSNLTAFAPPIAFPANVFAHSLDLRSNIVRFGLNYKFGGPVVANY